MKKTHWLLIFIGGIILWVGMILCCLIVLQFGSESFSREELIDASEEAYRFNPQNILTQSGNVPFVQIPFQENLSESSSATMLWPQEKYLQLINLFMKNILREDMNTWQLIDIGSSRFCSDEETGLSNFGVTLQKSVPFVDGPHRKEVSISLELQTGMVILLRREYAPDEGGERTIRWDDIKISAEQALEIADQHGGIAVRQALDNQCRVIISLKAGIMKNDWWVYYAPINDLSVFEMAVDEKTGNYHILREFGK